MARSVLITGAAGYIGRHTVAALAQRAAEHPHELGTIIALDVADVPQDQRLPGVVYEAGDINSPDLGALFQRHAIDVVVHLASVVRAPKNINIPAADFAYHVDVDGTRNVLDACLAAGVTRLVVTSSGAAYGYHADNPAWLDEEDPLRGNDDFPYARHKRLVEEMLAAWRRDHPEIKQLIFRPGTVVGPDVHSPVTDLFEKPVMLGVLGSSTPFVFIWDQDLVACLVEGVLGDKTGIYNQAGDGALTPRQLARLMRKPYVPLPALAIKAALAAAKRAGLTENGPERVKFLRYRPVLSNRRLKTEFGYTPRKTSREAFLYYAQARGLVRPGASNDHGGRP